MGVPIAADGTSRSGRHRALSRSRHPAAAVVMAYSAFDQRTANRSVVWPVR